MILNVVEYLKRLYGGGKMLAKERRNKIEALLREYKELDVSYIVDSFDVSSVTIRSDLIFLERKGIIERKFGKVIFKENLPNFSAFDPHTIKELDAKEKIGKYAVRLIEENESILLYAGSTTLQIARFFPKDKHAIIVTNSLNIANELRKESVAKIIFLGGNLNIETGSTYGIGAIKQLEDYNIDKLFLAVDGISAAGGITNDHPFETDINNAMIKKAKEVIVVADHTKVGVERFVKLQNLDKVHRLITTSKADQQELERIRALGVHIDAV